MTPSDRAAALARLRAFVRAHRVGGCRALSSPDCQCPLCDLDALEAADCPTCRQIVDCVNLLRKTLP